MVKMLLLEVWREWRLAEGLPVRPSYHEEKLGHVHGGASVAAAAGGSPPVSVMSFFAPVSGVGRSGSGVANLMIGTLK